MGARRPRRVGQGAPGGPYRAKSVRVHEAALRLHVLPYLGSAAGHRGHAWRGAPLARGARGGTTATTARGALDTLRVVHAPARRPRAHRREPLLGITPPMRDSEARPLRFLTPQEGDSCGRPPRRRAGPRRVRRRRVATGARRGELLGLAWGPGGVDLEDRRRDRRELVPGAAPAVEPTKSGPAPRADRSPGGGTAARVPHGCWPPGRRRALFPFDPRPAVGARAPLCGPRRAASDHPLAPGTPRPPGGSPAGSRCTPWRSSWGTGTRRWSSDSTATPSRPSARRPASGWRPSSRRPPGSNWPRIGPRGWCAGRLGGRRGAREPVCEARLQPCRTWERPTSSSCGPSVRTGSPRATASSRATASG